MKVLQHLHLLEDFCTDPKREQQETFDTQFWI